MPEILKDLFEIVMEEIKDVFFLVLFYVLGSLTFDFFLWRYNQTLIGKTAFEVMFDNNGLSWMYLYIAFLFLFGGAILIVYIWKKRKRIEYIENTFVLLGFIGIIIINLVGTVVLINNPILYSACVIIFIGTAIVMAK